MQKRKTISILSPAAARIKKKYKLMKPSKMESNNVCIADNSYLQADYDEKCKELHIANNNLAELVCVVKNLQKQIEEINKNNTKNTSSKVVKQTSDRYALPTKNNFDSLSDEDNFEVLETPKISILKKSITKEAKEHAGRMETDMPPTLTPTLLNEPAKKKKPPPIIIYNVDHKKTLKICDDTIGTNKTTLRKMNSNCTKIITETVGDYKSVVKVLKESADAQFYSFTPKEERKINIILRNICESYNEEEIKNAIEDLDLPIVINNIIPYVTERSKRLNRNLNLWLIQLEPGSDASKLISTRRLLNQVVAFERKHQKSVAQCRNCQRFGHSAINCSLKYRCVKCVNVHAPGECPLNQPQNKDVSPACVNCHSKSHPSNFRGCPSYTAYVNSKSKVVLENRENHKQAFNFNNTRRENVSYAQVAKQPQFNSMQKQTVDNGNMLDFLEGECNNKFGVNFDDMLQKAARFVPTYCTLNESEKPFALAKFMMSIAPIPLK